MISSSSRAKSAWRFHLDNPLILVDEFLNKLKRGETVSFQDTIAIITEHYDYQPSEFSNGLAEDILINAAGTNEGSCKIFAFGLLNQLNEQQTLSLFGDYYRKDVLGNPNGTDHRNIRNFMKYGWDGIRYPADKLSLRKKQD